MNRFNCEDCVLNGTAACRYGANKSNDYSDTCPDLFVEQNHAYEKGVDEIVTMFDEWVKSEPRLTYFWVEYLNKLKTFADTLKE